MDIKSLVQLLEMVCGEYGEGKMSDPLEIFDEIKNFYIINQFSKNLRL